MTLIEHNENGLVFELQRREREVFSAILGLYPLLNPDYHQLTRTVSEDPRLRESQEMLQDAMSEQRKANKKLVQQFLSDENWTKHERRYRVKVSNDQIEWLLHVLNDIRVGSWVILGKPDHEKGESPEITEENVQFAGAMELAGHFQMVLLHATSR